MKIVLICVVLLRLPTAIVVAQEHDEAVQEITDELRDARQIRTRLVEQLKFAERRVELLMEMRQLREHLAEIPDLIEQADKDGDERQMERLQEQAEGAEFEFEYLNARRDLLERRADLAELLSELPSDHKALQNQGQQLREMADRSEELLQQLFEVYREGPEDKERDLEERVEELEEAFEYRREVLGLRMELLHAENEGEEQWIEELKAELREIGAFEDDPDAQDHDARQSGIMKDLPPAITFTAQELTAAGRMNFDQQILPLLTSACFSCHDSESASGDLNLESLVTARPLVVNRSHWLNVIQQLKVRSMPPADADQPSEADRRILTAWLTNAIQNFDYDSVRQPGHEMARRLTHDEYNNTVRDLTGVDIRPADRFPADMAATSGFDNSANSLFLQPVLLERYLGAAEQIVEAAWPDSPSLPQHEAAWQLLLGNVTDLKADGAVRSVL